jgi:DeoR/GlpR family transcriptional regulator of sugar metabolism
MIKQKTFEEIMNTDDSKKPNRKDPTFSNQFFDLIVSKQFWIGTVILLAGLLLMGSKPYVSTNISEVLEKIGQAFVTSISITIIYSALIKKFEKTFISGEIQKLSNENNGIINDINNKISDFRNKTCDERHKNLKQDLNQKMSDYWYSSSKYMQKGLLKSSPYDAHTYEHDTLKYRSLFHYRLEHFVEEKRKIAEKYVALVLEAMNKLPEKKSVFMLLDSGSTIFHVFEVLCNAYHLGDEVDKKKLSRIKIITNSVSGANRLTEIGRAGGGIQADMLFNCFLLPGPIEGKYSAVLGEQTSKFLSEYLETIKNKCETWIFGAITGNYISITDGIMSRGDFHDSVKSEIIRQSDHIAILAPLGKIMKFSCNEINEGIKENLDPLVKAKEYKHIPNTSIDNMVNGKDDFKGKKVRLITSDKRDYYIPDKRITDISNHLNDTLTVIEHSVLRRKENNDFQLIKVKFNPVFDSQKVVMDISQNKYEAILQYEFPHPSMRSWKRELLFN